MSKQDQSSAPSVGGAARPHLSGPEMLAKLDALIVEAGGDPESREARYVRDLLLTSLKLVPDGRDTGELKLMASALKEMRHSYRVFAGYADIPKITIFGSARTPPDHPDYIAAVEFSREMAARSWLAITGAGDGIMKAGHEGPGREASFGLSIRLPFETTANEIIAGDSKLINFRYFFTRKLMFVSQADAVAVFPGGFGTQDEAFEVLTLVQTGKSQIVPIVMIEGRNGNYWEHWFNYIEHSLLGYGFISPEDLHLFHLAKDPIEAADYIARFYRNYHSARYINDDVVIRIRHRLRDDDIDRLNDEFAILVKTGRITQRGAFDIETDFLDLPRITFTHTRHKYGLVRRLIDRINEFDPVES
ncbi:MAG: LOG family protein [Planctomycetota bacterium]|nr:LOG family protein [Planctomycetota bacterium]